MNLKKFKIFFLINSEKFQTVGHFISENTVLKHS